MKKNFKGKIYIAMKFMFTFGVVFASTAVFSHANNPFSKANAFLEKVKLGINTVAIVAGVIGVTTGVLMKKFSMGKQDKIETGNRIIRETLIGVALMFAAPFIVEWISIEAAA